MDVSNPYIADSEFLSKSGGALTGPLTLSEEPTEDPHAATKKYVDDTSDALLPKSGGTMTGALILNGPPNENRNAATISFVNSKLPKSGGTMTGPLTLHGPPTADLHAATKAYVNTKLSKDGGVMTGPLTLRGPPTADLHAATKAYVDGRITITKLNWRTHKTNNPHETESSRGNSISPAGNAVILNNLPTGYKVISGAVAIGMDTRGINWHTAAVPPFIANYNDTHAVGGGGFTITANTNSAAFYATIDSVGLAYTT